MRLRGFFLLLFGVYGYLDARPMTKLQRVIFSAAVISNTAEVNQSHEAAQSVLVSWCWPELQRSAVMMSLMTLTAFPLSRQNI